MKCILMRYDMATGLGRRGVGRGGLKEKGLISSCIFMLSLQLVNWFWEVEEVLPCWRCVPERALRFQKPVPGPVCVSVCLQVGI